MTKCDRFITGIIFPCKYCGEYHDNPLFAKPDNPLPKLKRPKRA